VFLLLDDLRGIVKSRGLPRWKVFTAYVGLRTAERLRWFLRRGEQPVARLFNLQLHYSNYHALRHLFREIFIQQTYWFEADSYTPTIFDCGGNIGISVVYFKMLYPRARVVVFEPDPGAFPLLQKNIEKNALADVGLHLVGLCVRT